MKTSSGVVKRAAVSQRSSPRRLYDMTRSGRIRDPEARQVRVVRLIHARPHTLFRLLADPRNHTRLDGSGLLRGDPVGPDRLKLGDTFTMRMSQAGKAYAVSTRWWNLSRTAGSPGNPPEKWRGHSLVGGQRWRNIQQPNPAGTLVEHAYVWATPICHCSPSGFPDSPDGCDRSWNAAWPTLPCSLRNGST